MAAPNRDLLKSLRHEVAMSRADLAREVGSSYSHIYNVEQGYMNPSEDMLARLAKFFTGKLGRRIRLTDLVGSTAKDDPKPSPKDDDPRRAPTPRPDVPRPVAPPRPPGPKRGDHQHAASAQVSA